MTDYHILRLLKQYYLDKDKWSLYIRWDTYLAYKGFTYELTYMYYKSDDQINKLLDQAWKEATELKGTKLWKILK